MAKLVVKGYGSICPDNEVLVTGSFVPENAKAYINLNKEQSGKFGIWQLEINTSRELTPEEQKELNEVIKRGGALGIVAVADFLKSKGIDFEPLPDKGNLANIKLFNAIASLTNEEYQELKQGQVPAKISEVLEDKKVIELLASSGTYGYNLSHLAIAVSNASDVPLVKFAHLISNKALDKFPIDANVREDIEIEINGKTIGTLWTDRKYNHPIDELLDFARYLQNSHQTAASKEVMGVTFELFQVQSKVISYISSMLDSNKSLEDRKADVKSVSLLAFQKEELPVTKSFLIEYMLANDPENYIKPAAQGLVESVKNAAYAGLFQTAKEIREQGLATLSITLARMSGVELGDEKKYGNYEEMYKDLTNKLGNEYQGLLKEVEEITNNIINKEEKKEEILAKQLKGITEEEVREKEELGKKALKEIDELLGI